MSDQPKPTPPPAPKPAEPAKPQAAADSSPVPSKPTAVQDAAAAQSVTVFIPPHGLPKPPAPAAAPPAAPPARPPAPVATAPAQVAASASATPGNPPTTQTAMATRNAPAAPAPSSEPAVSFASTLTSKPAAVPATGQQKCTTCGHLNRAGLLICENCGTSLVAPAATILGTQKLDKKSTEAAAADAKLNTAEVHALMSVHSDQFDDTMILRLEIEGANTPILVYPRDETSLGRRDPAGGTIPDVDLTSYAAYRMGVSRRHALLTLKDSRLQLVDLGSSNGTMLNGVRLAPHQPRTVRDGDTITLGKMSLRALFQSGARR